MNNNNHSDIINDLEVQVLVRQESVDDLTIIYSTDAMSTTYLSFAIRMAIDNYALVEHDTSLRIDSLS